MNIYDIIFILVNILPFIFLGFIIFKTVNTEEPDELDTIAELDTVTVETDRMVYIKDNLFYNPYTMIVYKCIKDPESNNEFTFHYYSSDGYEYRYNSETKELEEVKEK